MRNPTHKCDEANETTSDTDNQTQIHNLRSFNVLFKIVAVISYEPHTNVLWSVRIFHFHTAYLSSDMWLICELYWLISTIVTRHIHRGWAAFLFFLPHFYIGLRKLVEFLTRFFPHALENLSPMNGAMPLLASQILFFIELDNLVHLSFFFLCCFLCCFLSIFWHFILCHC